MAFLKDIIDTNDETFSKLQALNIWSKPIESLKQLDLIVLARHIQAQTKNTRKTGHLVDLIVDSVRRAKIIGITDRSVALAMPAPQGECMTASQLHDWLSKMTLPRRRCFLFALLAKMRLSEAMTLTWKELARIQHTLPESSVEIAKLSVRHIRSELVFYEVKGQSALALSGLEVDSLVITGKTWRELLESSDNFIPDSKADIESILGAE